LKKDGLVVISTIGLVVYEPDEVGAVGSEVECDILGCGRFFKRDLAKRNTKGEVIVLAYGELSSCHIRCRRWGGGCICVLIVDSSHSVRGDTIVQCAALRTKLRAHPVGISRRTDSLNNDISALSNTEGDDVRGVWLYGYEIDGDNSKSMTVDAEFLDTLGTGVDETKEMLLARLELELGDTCVGFARKRGVCARILHLAVDQVVVGWREATVHRVVDERVVVGVIPIFEQNWANVDVILGVLRAVDYKRSVSTTGILSAVMA
jgi:hypothetical protein